MGQPSRRAWLYALPTPLAEPLRRAEQEVEPAARLLALGQATTSLLRYLALIALLEQVAQRHAVPEIGDLLEQWLHRPGRLEELWRLVREGIRAIRPRWIPRFVFYAPNGRTTWAHTDVQRLIELSHLVTERSSLSSHELASIERQVQPDVRLYRLIAALDPLWEWEICTALTAPEGERVRARIWRGPEPREDWRPWPISPQACLWYHPKEARHEALPPFVMAARCSHPHETEESPASVLAWFHPEDAIVYRGWSCEHPVDVPRGLASCRAFLDTYEAFCKPSLPKEEARTPWEEDLSPRQREIVRAGEPQILVVAGAGSGKTRVLTYRIAYLIEQEGVSPDRILAVTFTNRAAREMKHRLRDLLGEAVDTEEMWVGTFHAICLRILREEIAHLGYRPAFSVVDPEAQEMLIEEAKADARYALRQATRERIGRIVDSLTPSPAQRALRQRDIQRALRLYRRKPPRELTADDLIGMGIARWGTEFGHHYLQRAQSLAPDHPDLPFLLACFEKHRVFQSPTQELAERINLFKDNLQDPEQVMAEAADAREQAVAELYRRYQDKLRRSNLVDFGDLIRLTWKLFREFPEVLEKYQRQFEHILVDEFQDINSAQDQWLQVLADRSRIFCVGDADQLIYEWRGANVETILAYEKRYSRQVLEENYRSGRRILSAANSVIQHNALRQEKALRAVLDREGVIFRCALENESAEATFVAEEIERLVQDPGLNLADIAILYRVNAKAEGFRQALQQREIPHRVVGGQRFYEQPEVRHALNYLRLIYNPHDQVSLKQLLRYQLNPAWVSILEDFAREQGCDFFYALRHLTEVPQLDAFAQEQLARMRDQLRRLCQNVPDPSEPLDLPTFLRYTIVQECIVQPRELPPVPLTYLQHLSLEELLSIAQRFHETESERTIRAFLEYIALFSRQDDLQTGEADAVTLMTMHSGKGLEFEAVFVVGCVDGLIPLLRRSREEDLPSEVREQMEFRQLEEERRLFYVSLTRAKSFLYLTYPKARETATGTASTTPSRFLEEIPESYYTGLWTK